ncbi:universal stress protein [Halobacteriales archaeon QS_3_64_16]|nr:MAG: universal stress protein [Halobacteriales archaeon QS_3_64_16]
MIDQLVIATDGSESGERAVSVALDLACRFDATIYSLSVVDTTGENESNATTQEDWGDESIETRRRRAQEAVEAVADRTDREVRTSVREGAPAAVVRAYAEEHAADLVATGTRGRHGAHRFLLGSVAEAVVRTCPVPVLTVRQLANAADSDAEA